VKELPDYAKGLTVLAASLDPKLVGHPTEVLLKRAACQPLGLYWTLTDLVKLGLIERRRESVPSQYVITQVGKRLLKAEFTRLSALMRAHDG
jgi:CTP-dependent riboflavin kinase